MRLISDEDLKDRASEYCLSEDEFRRFCKIIDAEPTACDVDDLKKLANCKELEEVTGIPLKELAEIFSQHIPDACQHPEKACVLTDGDVDKWRKYQQLDKHGRLIKLPCKVGDTAYCIENKEIWICIVENISMSKNNGTCIEISFPPEMPDISAIEYSPNEIGEVVFFTKPEAEAKLEELGCCEDEKASDEERFYQCLNCLYIKDCNLDEKAEDKRGMCKKYLSAEMCVGRYREKYCNKCKSKEQCHVPCGSVTRYIFEMLKN